MAWSPLTTFLVTCTLLTVCSAKFGFIASRGKRSLDNDVTTSPNNIDSTNALHESIAKQIALLEFLRYHPDERMPGFFNEASKRAPMGFVGMRGKKADEYSMDDAYDATDLSSSWTSPKEDLYDFYRENYEKRAPTGFLGMRGRREGDKRVPTGFFGMRGKRVPTGFMGMRGKKDPYYELYDEKRAPLVQFFGIRGKKMPLHSGFFGMRGKKQPFEFRRKFVGVRGKKIPEGSLKQLEQQLNDYTNFDNLNKMDAIGSPPSSASDAVKRAPSGFMGMRGKKDEEEVNVTE